MSKAFWPLVPDNVFDAQVRAAMHQVIDGEQHTMNEHVRTFEQQFAELHNKKWAVMANSGSSANLLAVAAIDRKLGPRQVFKPEVIVPAVAWATTYSPFHQHGFRFVVCDVKQDTFGISMLDAVSAYDEQKTEVLCAASILGFPAKLEELKKFAEAVEVSFFEDNCESLGAIHSHKLCGTFGKASTFSFFYTHHLGIGEGGMLLTDDDEIYDIAVSMRAHGWTRDLRANSSLRELFNDFEAIPGRYDFIMPGYNVRPTEIQAAAGRVQLGRLSFMQDQRVINYNTFNHLFGTDARWTIQQPSFGDSPVPFAFCLVFNSRAMRKDAVQLMNENGIECRMITGGSFAKHPVAETYDWRYATPEGTPVADRIHECGLFVGNHGQDLAEQIFALYDVLNKGLK